MQTNPTNEEMGRYLIERSGKVRGDEAQGTRHRCPARRVSAAEVFDVAIVGCGPVGGVLATLLGQRGHRVVVLERHPQPYQLPRAVHFDHEVARILQGCGLGSDLADISEPGSEYEWRNGSGQVLLRFGGRPVGPSGWPDANMFWQPALEARIERAAASHPSVEVRRGRRVVTLDDRTATAGHVALTVDAGPAGAEQVRARFVIGCDGANSTVRDLVGIEVTDLGFFYDWLIVDVVLHEPRVFDPINVQICEPARPTTVVSGGPGRRRWEFMRLPHESTDELDDEERAWRLLEPWDVTADDATLERHAVYRFQARWADRWRVGSVLIAGDAAHQMPPFAGQGMCSGIRDAANLAWKLDLVLTDRAPHDLLHAYQAERHDNVKAVIELSMALGRVICITDADEAAGRDELMAAGAAAAGAQAMPPLPGVTVGVVRAGDPLAGQLFVQGRVAAADDSSDAPALLDDVAGVGWRIVTPDPAVAASVPLDAVSRFAALGGQIVAVDATRDVDLTYARWFAEHDVIAVVQRPDFNLFGAATSTDDLVELLAHLDAALARPAAVRTPTPTPVSNGGTP